MLDTEVMVEIALLLAMGSCNELCCVLESGTKGSFLQRVVDCEGYKASLGAVNRVSLVNGLFAQEATWHSSPPSAVCKKDVHSTHHYTITDFR